MKYFIWVQEIPLVSFLLTSMIRLVSTSDDGVGFVLWMLEVAVRGERPNKVNKMVEYLFEKNIFYFS